VFAWQITDWQILADDYLILVSREKIEALDEETLRTWLLCMRRLYY